MTKSLLIKRAADVALKYGIAALLIPPYEVLIPFDSLGLAQHKSVQGTKSQGCVTLHGFKFKQRSLSGVEGSAATLNRLQASKGRIHNRLKTPSTT